MWAVLWGALALLWGVLIGIVLSIGAWILSGGDGDDNEGVL